MAINKVEYVGRSLIDLTTDTVREDSLLEGYTAHNSSGDKIVGTAVPRIVSGVTIKYWSSSDVGGA